MFHNTFKRLCCIAVVIIVTFLGIMIFVQSQRIIIPFYPSSAEIVDPIDKDILNRFRLSEYKKEKILNNADKYCIVEVCGEIHNDSGTEVCDMHIKAEFKKPSAGFIEAEYRLNESPAFARTDIDEKTEDSVLLLVEKEYYESGTEEEFINSIDFSVSVLKYSDEKFSRVYGA